MRHIDLFDISGYSLTLYIPEKTIADKIKALVKTLVRKIRHKLPQRKIYLYGTNGLVYFDHRTKAEKINDWLCDKIFDRPKEFKRQRGIAKLYDFISFFDDANGQKIWNREQIKNMERAGQVMLSPQEAEREFKRFKQYKEEAFQKKSTKLFEEKLRKVSQGYSYRKQFANAEKFSKEALHRHLQEA